MPEIEFRSLALLGDFPSPEEAYRVLHDLLRRNGFTIDPTEARYLAYGREEFEPTDSGPVTNLIDRET